MDTDRDTQQLPTHDWRGNPLVPTGECPLCKAPETRGGMRVGMYVSFDCGTVGRPVSWEHGLTAYDMPEIRKGENCV